MMKMKWLISMLPLLGTVVLFSCTDDDDFSTSAALRLTFSEDSVAFDTVFSQVPTATKTFWVRLFGK